MTRGERDIRDWIGRHPRLVPPYTRQRIGESYAHVGGILERFEELRLRRALDVGCGSGFDSFALADRFDEVVAIDASRRRVRAAGLLARAAHVRGIKFHRAMAETFTTRSEFDFVYCNIMSELVSSRRLLAANIAALGTGEACVYYAEETEGYAAMEIAAAIAQRDTAELRARLRQVANGFCGFPWFRFYLAGSAASLFAEFGFQTVAARQKEWNGLVYEDAVWLRRVQLPLPPSPGHDRDYAVLDPDFAAMRSRCLKLVNGEPDGAEGSDAAGDCGRFAPYLVLVKLAVEVLGVEIRKPPSLAERLRARAGRLPAPDWSRAGDLMGQFMREIEAPGA